MNINEEYYVLTTDKVSDVFSNDAPMLGKPYSGGDQVCNFYPQSDGECGFDFILEAVEPLVDKPVYEVLSQFKLDNVTLIPAKVHMNDEVEDYHIVHFNETFASLDKENSEIDDIAPMVLLGVDKLVLDEEALAAIPLEKRLIYPMQESIDIIIVHKSIVDAIYKKFDELFEDIADIFFKNLFVPVSEYEGF